MAELMGSRKTSTRMKKRAEVARTEVSIVEYTFPLSSPLLLANRKKVVSIP